MKRSLAIGIVILLVFGIYPQEYSNSNPAKYFLIRHAEKVVSKDRDPALKVRGALRAEKWAEVLKSVKLDAVYSTNYKRTMATAQPAAESQGLEITSYHPTEIDYAQFKADTRGKTVLIVGHSNTIPGFVNQLIGQDKYPDIEHNNNGNLYIVELGEDYVSDMLLHVD